jgi:hypothetical protein
MDNVDWVDMTIVDYKMGKIQKYKQWFYKGLQNKGLTFNLLKYLKASSLCVIWAHEQIRVDCLLPELHPAPERGRQ